MSMKNKEDFRKYISALKSQLTEDEIVRRSLILSERLFDSQAYQDADIVLAYMSANQEVRTDRIISRALADGKKAAVPVTFPGRRMEFVYYDTITAFNEKWGIAEPVDGTAALPMDCRDHSSEGVCSVEIGGSDGQPGIPAELSSYTIDFIDRFSRILVLLPGLAFGRDMNRIGYGGGFYDRYLKRLEKAGHHFTRTALCFDFQVFDTLPADELDQKCDLLIDA